MFLASGAPAKTGNLLKSNRRSIVFEGIVEFAAATAIKQRSEQPFFFL